MVKYPSMNIDKMHGFGPGLWTKNRNYVCVHVYRSLCPGQVTRPDFDSGTQVTHNLTHPQPAA